MISRTTVTPADLLGMGGNDVRPAYGPGRYSGFSELDALHMAAPTAPVQGTGVPAAGTAVRLRAVTRQPIGDAVVTTTFQNNGTTLGIHSSRRPQS